jgi:predicted nucleic acid-binding protein
MHGDPADTITGATALVLNATLVTADRQLQQVAGLGCVW